MTQIPTKEELQDFALNFDIKIVRPLVNAGYDKYNVFDILNISRQELRHSDFLAFLLDPNKSGYVGQQFLRNFLIFLSKDIVPNKLDFFDMLYGNFEEVNVYREVAVKDGRIDILIELEIVRNEVQKIVVAIENKVDSDQHDNQLEKYKKFLDSDKYKNYKKVPLYLTPNKADSKNEDWLEVDYSFIYSILNRVDIATADNTIKTLVDDYKKMIRREFDIMDEKESELRKLALEIYTNEINRKIIDFIYDSIPDWREETAKIIRELLIQKGASLPSNKQNTYIEFTTKELANYEGYYFQINTKDMSFVFRKDLTHNQCASQWLFGNAQDSLNAVENYKKWVLTDKTKLKESCMQMIEKAFGDNGVIATALATLKS